MSRTRAEANKLPEILRSNNSGIDANQYDRVLGFFKSKFDDDRLAETFTGEIFRISEVNQLPIDSIIGEFESSSDSQISVLLAYYLNTIRNKPSFLGVSTRMVPPIGVARNIKP